MVRLWDEPYYVVMEVKNERCRILKTLKAAGVQEFKVADVRSSRGGAVRHLVEIPPEQIQRIEGEFARMREGGPTRKPSIWVQSEGCDVCNAILSHGSFLISGRTLQGSTFIYSFIAPNFDAYKSITSALEASGLKASILRLGKFKPKKEVLTEKQEKILWLALKAGFFDYPRKVDTLELSRRLGISPSTFSETVRRGVRRLLERHFEA